MIEKGRERGGEREREFHEIADAYSRVGHID